jgi:hypothetical protein
MILRGFDDAVSTVDFTEDLIGLKDNSGRWIDKDLEGIGVPLGEGFWGKLRKLLLGWLVTRTRLELDAFQIQICSVTINNRSTETSEQLKKGNWHYTFFFSKCVICDFALRNGLCFHEGYSSETGRTGWSTGNTPDLYSHGTRFESLPRYRLSTLIFSWFSSVHSCKYWDSTSIMPGPSPSKICFNASFISHHITRCYTYNPDTEKVVE